MSGANYAVIMAGGRGERFWPLSTAAHPKQMLALFGGKPMIALAVDYLSEVVPAERTFIVTAADLCGAMAAAVPSLPAANIVGEPCGRDTAAACALGTLLVRARDPRAALCVLTADHVIRDVERFRRVLREGLAVAAAGRHLITIGIQPTWPNTGFGYIQAGDRFAHAGQVAFHVVRRFAEKPDAATAARYVAEGSYCWNAGMFMWSAAAFEAALRRHRPPLAEMVERLLPAVGGRDFEARLAAEYGGIEKISVDYAILERADNILMARGDFGWDDVGTWTSLANHFAADADGNVVIGACEAVDSSGNVVVSERRLTALVGVRDLVVVQAEGATLVCPRDRAQDVKMLVQRLRARGGREDVL